MSIFKACDIRGVAGDELNEAIVLRIGRSLGAMVRRRQAEPVCLGGDFRRSTPALKQAVLEGLLEAGVSVRDVGQVPTPVVYFAAMHLNCPSVAIVTASHNAGKYNGVKFMLPGEPAIPDLMRELERGLEPFAAKRPEGCSAQMVPVPFFDVLPAYESWVRQRAASLFVVRPLGRSDAPYGLKPAQQTKIVLDAMEGAFTDIAPRILAAEGCQVVSIGGAIDPDFARRSPNPADDGHLRGLAQRVVAERADLGIALDGDGDRAAFVDHTGRIIRPEQIAAWLVQQCFPRPTVVYDQKCASVVTSAVRAAGGTAIMQPSGYGFIKTAMIQHQADLGVEVSGHYFVKALSGGDDGLFAALVVAHLLAQSPKPLAALIEAIGWPAITPDLRIGFQGDSSDILERIAQQCGGTISRMDGVRAEYDDGWALARASITEPLMTFRFEACTPDRLQQIAARFLAAVPDLHQRVRQKLMIGDES